MAKTTSNSIQRVQGDPYMRSQTFFMKNAQLAENTKRMKNYQEAHSNYLSQPKREVPKFIGKTMALNARTQRRTTFTDKFLAISSSPLK